MPGGRRGAVAKAVDFIQLQPLAVEQSRHMASARCPQIDRQIGPLRHDSPEGREGVAGGSNGPGGQKTQDIRCGETG